MVVVVVVVVVVVLPAVAATGSATGASAGVGEVRFREVSHASLGSTRAMAARAG